MFVVAINVIVDGVQNGSHPISSRRTGISPFTSARNFISLKPLFFAAQFQGEVPPLPGFGY